MLLKTITKKFTISSAHEMQCNGVMDNKFWTSLALQSHEMWISWCRNIDIAVRLEINKTGNVRVTYIETLSCNHYCSGKVISVTCSECVFVAEVSSKKCACAIFPSVACPAIQYFSKFLINGTTLEQKLLKIVCVFWFYLQLLSETFLILRRNEWDMKKCVLVFI